MVAHNFIDLTGQTFMRLTVVKQLPSTENGRALWQCNCECGVTLAVLGKLLRSGHTRSCGCLQRDTNLKRVTKHGMARVGQQTPEFHIWCHIRARTSKSNAPGYANYGGRGIVICTSWRTSFATFYTDMGPRPSPKHSIDRRDNDGHYSYGKCSECLENSWTANCRWATRKEQADNTRRNVNLTYQGQVKNISQWAVILKIKSHTLRKRIKEGWSIKRAFTSPVQFHHPSPIKD